jgi:L-fuconate dehydratase
MRTNSISAVRARDRRFPLQPGEGADAVHSNPVYSYAVTELSSSSGLVGAGLALTLGAGNELVCAAVELLAADLVGLEIEELMAGFGEVQRRLADHPQLRWLGPHKGVTHLALASITNACFDLWAKSRGLPLWRLLLELTPAQVVALLDLSYLEDVLTPTDTLALLENAASTRAEREPILRTGYPGYDTGVGWFHYEDARIVENARKAAGAGFGAMKLKVGSVDPSRDQRRAFLVREAVGPDVTLMLDVNQQWTLPQAMRRCADLGPMDPYWIEEPTHPDDVLAHQALARAIAPIRIALGEHVPNRVLFKNFLQAGAVQFVQVDCTRVAGVSEFIAVSLLARHFGIPVAPHVGDMGQIHQHLVLFNHIVLGHEALFLEYIPHLRDRFVSPARVVAGVYRPPDEPGSSSDLHG